MQYVRSEAIWERSSRVVERAGREAKRFMHLIHRRLVSARMPNTAIALQSVRMGGFLTIARPFLVVRSDRFPDVRVYVGARPAGLHLEVLMIIAVEPAWPKRVLAGAMRRGAWWLWSLPSQVWQEEDLRTLLTVVEATVQTVARKLAARSYGRLLPVERGSALEEWL